MKPEVSPDFQSFKYYNYYSSYGADATERSKNKNLSMFDTKDVNLNNIEKTAPEKAAGWVRKGWRKWKKGLRFSFLVLTVALVAGGLLWQDALLGPFKSGNTEGEAKSSAGDLPQALFRKAETTPNAVPEEKNVVAVVPPKEEAPLSTPIAPLAAIKEERPIVPRYSESVGKQEGAIIQKTMADPVTPPSNPNARKISRPYSLFLSSVPDADFAKDTVSQWSKRGFAPYYVKLILSQGEQYWIYLGCFESRAKAEAFKKQNDLASATIRSTPYANMVGVYDSLEELQRQEKRLMGLGYSS